MASLSFRQNNHRHIRNWYFLFEKFIFTILAWYFWVRLFVQADDEIQDLDQVPGFCNGKCILDLSLAPCLDMFLFGLYYLALLLRKLLNHEFRNPASIDKNNPLQWLRSGSLKFMFVLEVSPLIPYFNFIKQMLLQRFLLSNFQDFNRS